ncbi:cytochrome c biogenesis CcdA family protein [Gordonia sp. VNK1]|uniref:cytochrome c biogenesis CcdA family protein n=1 Tax=Gordonia oleivorans TaxID=3156618 RepID=UPI0032B3C708
MDIGLFAAFLGGALALLSPCAALLLPAFFASSVGARGRLIVHGVVFYLGLMITLVPIGIGVGALALTVAHHRSAIIAGAALLIVVLGVLQIFGRGFDLGRLLPGMSRLQDRSMQRSGFVKTLLLGAVSGVAGFCTGPILGAVLTMAATRGMGGAALLLAVYGMGMVVPLMLIAATWTRLGALGQTTLRGRDIAFAGLHVHTTHLNTGLLLIAVGVGFWLTNGFIGIPEPVSTDTQQRLQDGVSILANPMVDVAGVLLLTAVLLGWWWYHRSRNDPAARSNAAQSTDKCAARFDVDHDQR